MGQEGERERTTDDVSKDKGDVETGDALELRDESGGCLLTAQMASGVEVARAWLRLLHGTWEPVALMPRERSKSVDPMRIRVPMQGTGTEPSVVGLKAL